MAAPEGSEERSNQEHVADRAEANDKDVGGDGVGGHERIFRENGERRRENGSFPLPSPYLLSPSCLSAYS